MKLSVALSRVRGWLGSGALILFVIAFTGVPFWMVLVNSWKSEGEALTANLALPSTWQLVTNYTQVLTEDGVVMGLVNSLVVVISSVVGILILTSMASWVFARSTRRRFKILHYVSLTGIVIPPAIVTTILVLRALDLYGTLLGLICVYIAAFIPFGVLLMTGFIKTIPVELEEAARIDGASQLIIYWRIVLPMLAPVLATAGFILTIAIWNDFFFSFFVLSQPDQSTLTLNLFNVVTAQQYEVRWQLVFANVVLSSLPLMAIYPFVHKRLVSGLSAGAIVG